MQVLQIRPDGLPPEMEIPADLFFIIPCVSAPVKLFSGEFCWKSTTLCPSSYYKKKSLLR